ncbi:MAG: hypothetical protein PHH48_08435 [Eubacteriales bacterium]|nr:hypothetical protein [Eubacteriales bacterium]
MIYNLKNPSEVIDLENRVNELIEQRAVVDLTKKNPNRSLSQNAYLHVILGFFASELGYTLEEVKQGIFKQICNKEIFVRNIEVCGKPIEYLRSSKDLDSQEMTTAIERFRNWSSLEAGIYLPSADEKHFISHMQKELRRYKQWI